MITITPRTIITIINPPAKDILQKQFASTNMTCGFNLPLFNKKGTKFKYLIINPVGKVITYTSKIHGVQMTWEDYLIHTNK